MTSGDRGKRRIFYGWWIVAACFFIALYVGGAIFYSFTTIITPIADELGWSYTQISFAASLRGLEMGMLAPLIGILVDRLGPRRLVFSGAIICTAGLILLSQASSLIMFYVAFALMALGISTTNMTVLMTAVANWFRRKVGTASGLAASGFGFGGLLIPVIVKLIDAYDWRTAMLFLSGGMLCFVLPLSLVLRHKPEKYGYLPDGEVQAPTESDVPRPRSPAKAPDFKAKQALKSIVFWRIAIAFVFFAMVVSATITHVMPYLNSIGIPRSTSSLIATAIPLMSIGGRLGLGWLGDKLSRKKVAALGLAMMSLGTLCYANVPSFGLWLLIPFLILFGLGYGGCSVIRPGLAREYFGRSNFGTILGLFTGIAMIGMISGAPLAGWVFDNWGSYQGIWFVFALLPVVALTLLLTIQETKPTEKS